MKKHIALLAFGLVAQAATAQNLFTEHYFGKPLKPAAGFTLNDLKLDYQGFKPTYRLSWDSKPDIQRIDFFVNARRDPFKWVNGKRFDFKEVFGASFDNGRTSIDFSTGNTSEGRITSFGFGIGW